MRSVFSVSFILLWSLVISAPASCEENYTHQQQDAIQKRYDEMMTALLNHAADAYLSHFAPKALIDHYGEGGNYTGFANDKWRAQIKNGFAKLPRCHGDFQVLIMDKITEPMPNIARVKVLRTVVLEWPNGNSVGTSDILHDTWVRIDGTWKIAWSIAPYARLGAVLEPEALADFHPGHRQPPQQSGSGQNLKTSP